MTEQRKRFGGSRLTRGAAALVAAALLLASAPGAYAAASPSEPGARLDGWFATAWSSLGQIGAEIWNGVRAGLDARVGATSTESSTDTEGDGETDPGGGGGFVDPDGTFGG